MKKKLPLVAALLAGPLLAVPLAAAPILYTADLSGPQENPPVPSAGTGTADVSYDSDARTLRVAIEFAGLTGTTTVAHIHCCVDPPGNVGVASQVPTFPGFPAGVTGGAYDQTFDLALESSYSPDFLAGPGGGTAAGAEEALALGLAGGQAYVNIHSDYAPGGEIRGFLVPVPAALPLLLSAFGALWVLRRR